MSQPNGGLPPEEVEPTGGEVVISFVAGTVQHLTRCDAGTAMRCAMRALSEVEKLHPVLDDAGNDNARQYPRWGANLQRQGEAGKGQLIGLKPSQSVSPENQIQASIILSLLTSPIARAVLYAQGFEIAFFQAPPDAPKSKLILP